jgi:hypothetical protein
MPSRAKAAAARERLRGKYRPIKVRMLFVGESPPASGRFFYQADSGLYRAVRSAFITALPALGDADFLKSFRTLGCYLVDLCGQPVDRLEAKKRRHACAEGEARLSWIIKRLEPEMIVTVVRSIVANVERAQRRADWSGVHLVLPYPGRWQHHKVAFEKELVPVLRRELRSRLNAEPGPNSRKALRP